MESLSVIVTAHNCAGLIGRALQSVAASLARWQDRGGNLPAEEAEVIVVDDGSTDDTPRAIQAATGGRPGWRVIRRPQAGGPSCARNAGVREARGSLLFFLDGDDQFLPGHIAACYQALQDDEIDFVKTGVRLADAVHPDWKLRIENSLVINLCLRRASHDAVRGFPDYHLFRRDGEEFRHDVDIFFKLEDMFYNRLIGSRFRGRVLPAETVEYCRRPGNAYDRQYEKFRRPVGQYPEAPHGDERFRLRLGEIIFQDLLERREPKRSGRTSEAPGQTVGALVAARQCLQGGDVARAEALCREILRAEVGSAEAWHLLGSVLQSQGKLAEAVVAYRRAAESGPDWGEAHLALGRALAANGDTGQAVAAFRRALELAPDNAEVLLAAGVCLAQAGRLAEAFPLLEGAVRHRPESAPARHNLGVALAQAGRLEQAASSLEEALRLDPAYGEAYFNLGNVLRDLGRKDDAVERYRRALELRPGHGEGYVNLGLTLSETGRPAEAIPLLRQAARQRPGSADAHNGLGLALAELGRFAEAEACYQEALRLSPAFTAAHCNLGNAYKEQGRFEEALACYQVALWHEPGAASVHYNRALTWLQMGEYAQGWPAYEWRWRRPSSPPRAFRQPRWNGSALEGRSILLWCEQGLGDAIQFVRYAGLVKARGGRVVLQCPGFLVPLFSSCAGVDQLVAEGEALPECDLQAPLLSLPGLLETTLATVPATTPYLAAPAERVEAWGRKLAAWDGFKVGVVWQGNPYFPWDRHRSFPLALLEPLARVAGVRLISLQKTHGVDQLRELAGRFRVTELGDAFDVEGGAFLDTAAVMQGLDLVVSADTAVAHLAGALGVPVWMALSQVADWRWLRGREDTPWYPSMRLFRQRTLGDWASVFERMAAELSKLCTASSESGGVRLTASPGELLDKLTILEIKSERITEPQKLACVRAELAALRRAWEALAISAEEVVRIKGELRRVNEAL